MKLKILLTAILGFFILSSAIAAPQELVGTWDLEINADGEYFYLTLVLEETEGELSGRISEEEATDWKRITDCLRELNGMPPFVKTYKNWHMNYN